MDTLAPHLTDFLTAVVGGVVAVAFALTPAPPAPSRRTRKSRSRT